MTEYNIINQRQAAIKTLKAKYEQVYAAGNEAAWKGSFCLFEVTLTIVKDYTARGFGFVVEQWQTRDKSVKFAVRCVAIDEQIRRLEAGEDPRILLYEVVSDG